MLRFRDVRDALSRIGVQIFFDNAVRRYVVLPFDAPNDEGAYQTDDLEDAYFQGINLARA